MTLSDWLTVASLAFVVYAVGNHGWHAWIAPRLASRGGDGGESVKKKRRAVGFKRRSRGSNVQNAVNAGSEHQDAPPPTVNVQNVQVTPAAIAEPAPGDVSSSDAFTLTTRELVQLAEALHERAAGATVEQAVCKAFGVSKGGSEGYRRAKALFDAATVAPGAAPAGTYAPSAAPRRRSRAAAR